MYIFLFGLFTKFLYISFQEIQQTLWAQEQHKDMVSEQNNY
jgi:hypothetical protein